MCARVCVRACVSMYAHICVTEHECRREGRLPVESRRNLKDQAKKRDCLKTAEVAQWLRLTSVLAEDSNLVPRTGW